MKIQHFYLASKNRHKIREVREIIAGTGLVVNPCPEEVILPEEKGETFEENALCKAETLYRIFPGEAVAGEDSGLIVPALGGLPGIYSARFAGPECDYRKNNSKLLSLMCGFTEPSERKAIFVAVVALLWPGGRKIFRGEVEGIIAKEPRGEFGFGYDPVFELPGSGKTFAEMSSAEKHLYSHRSRAFRSLTNFLLQLSDSG